MSATKFAVALLMLFIAFKGCSMAKAASTRRAEQQIKLKNARTRAVVPAPEPAAVEPVASRPAGAPVQPTQSGAPSASGWVSGREAEDALRRFDAERQRQAAEPRTFQGQPAAPSPGPQSAAAQRRAAGLASYAECNAAESRVRTIRNAQKSGAKVYALTLQGSGSRHVDKDEAAAILTESERFIAEKCRQ